MLTLLKLLQQQTEPYQENYNEFYNTDVLENKYINENVGAEIERHKIYIDNDSTMMEEQKVGSGPGYTIDYYGSTSSETNATVLYLKGELTSYNDILTRYNTNKNRMKIKIKMKIK